MYIEQTSYASGPSTRRVRHSSESVGFGCAWNGVSV